MEQNPNEIFVTFTFQKNKKQLYIDVNKNATLKEALRILTNKYEWLQNMSAMGASFNEKQFKPSDLNRTLYELGIKKDHDNIRILTDNVKVDLFADAKTYCRQQKEKEKQNQQNNNNFNQFNNNQFNNFPINQFQFNQNQGFNNFNMQNQPFNQFQNNMNMNNMQNNDQNQPFYKGSTRLREIYTLLTDSGFCHTPKDHLKLINFLNALYRANYKNKLYCTYIPVSRNDYAWQQFKRLTSNNRSFSEAAYRILKLFPAKQAPDYVIKDIGNYLSNVTNGQFMTYVEKNHNKQPVVNNNMNMNNQNMNMNNMQNNVQSQPFFSSPILQTIFNYLTTNGFCLPRYKDRIQLIQLLNNLYITGIYKNIPDETQNSMAWKNFRSLKSSNNRYYMEAVYRILYLFPKDNQQAQLKFLECANVKMDDLLQYANSRKNIPNNQMMMNNMNMQNNFNNQLMNGFYLGNWFTWDKRPIETLINAAGINVDKYMLYNHICKQIHEIDRMLRQPNIYKDSEQYYKHINMYNQALRFLSLYFADIIERSDPIHYSYYFKKYNSMYRFVPQYIDPINKSQQNGKVTFYNTAAKCYRGIPLAQLDNTNDLPEICDNVGQTCFANACRNMILSNKMLRVVLSRIGEELLLRNQDMSTLIMNFMNDNTITAGTLCGNATHCKNMACVCQLSIHAKNVTNLARQKKWGVLEMLCLYAHCADLASQITNYHERSKFLGKIFAATMVIIGDEDQLFRTAGPGDANDLSESLNGILTERLSRHIKRKVPNSNLMGQERLGRSLYGNYNNIREGTNDSAIPGQLAVKVSGTEYQCGHNKFGAQIDSFIMLLTPSYTNPGLQTPGGMIYDLQSALSFVNPHTLLQGENAIHCNVCKHPVNAGMDTQYVCGSLLSQLRLNYGKGNNDRRRVAFNEYVVNWNIPTTHLPEVYQLKCFIAHQGGNGPSSHYISYHKVPTGKIPPYQWYRLDDGMLISTNNNTIQGILQNPSFSNGSVTMRLYYERVPYSQMMGDPYGILSVTNLTIPSHEDLKLGDPLYISFFNNGNNNYGEPNPNNPYTAVLGLQQLLTNLGIGNLVNQQQKQNVENLYKNWNISTNCAYYNNNLYPAQPMNNMFMNNFMFQQQFMMPNNIGANMGMKQGINIPFKQKVFK